VKQFRLRAALQFPDRSNIEGSSVSAAAHAVAGAARNSRTENAPLYFTVPLLLFCGACFILFFGWTLVSPALVETCTALLDGSDRCASGINKIRIYSLSFALFPLILLLERRYPANAQQGAFSPGLVTDAWWFLFFPVLGVWLPTLFDELLKVAFGVHLAGLRINVIGHLPVALQIALVVLFADFIAYVSHVIRHKVPVLWEFHKIHHSQEQLNYFSSVRLHPLDLIANSLIRFLPFTLLEMEMAVSAFLGWVAFQRFYEMFVHSNLHMNLGPLRFVLVTPQSHRLHHSIEPEHRDTNFGNIFSIWDFMFGTQVKDCRSYPLLGVNDQDVPRNRSAGILDGARTFLQELAYPLIVLFRPRR
jgi:sterol desaturase/sphingolipid hydroxylase (fatty acid hydroxylase superfamily)